MTSSPEIWKDIPGYEGRYQVSDMGRVKSLAQNAPRFLKPGLCKEYRYVILCDAGRRRSHAIHRLVAQVFLPNPNGKPQINHKDGNKENNCSDNLEWVTCSENNLHRRRVLNGGGGKPSRAVVCVDTGVMYSSVSSAARAMGVNMMSIIHACRGKNKTACGFCWAYYEEVKACER